MIHPERRRENLKKIEEMDKCDKVGDEMTREQAKTVLDLMLTTANTTLCETEKNAIRTASELLNEQEEREKAICKEICDFIRGACSTDTDDDKDFVCYEIQKCFKRSVNGK